MDKKNKAEQARVREKGMKEVRQKLHDFKIKSLIYEALHETAVYVSICDTMRKQQQ